jgi:hypothetical protein
MTAQTPLKPGKNSSLIAEIEIEWPLGAANIFQQHCAFFISAVFWVTATASLS